MARLAEQGSQSGNDQCPCSLVLVHTEHTHSCKMFEFQKAFFFFCERRGHGTKPFRKHYHLNKSVSLQKNVCIPGRYVSSSCSPSVCSHGHFPYPRRGKQRAQTLLSDWHSAWKLLSTIFTHMPHAGQIIFLTHASHWTTWLVPQG